MEESDESSFEIIPFEQYLSCSSDIPLEKYVHLHLYNSLKSILKTRTEYKKANENKNSVKDNIDGKISKYFRYFHSVTNSFDDPPVLSPSSVTKDMPTFEKGETIFSYCNRVIEYMSRQPENVNRVFLEPIIDSFPLISPKNADDAISFAFACFSVGAHHSAGLNSCIDALYSAIQVNQNEKITPNKYFDYQQETFSDLAVFEPIEVPKDSPKYACEMMALRIMDQTTKIITGNLFNIIEYSEEELEICIRIIERCASLEDIKEVVVAATLRCIAAYLHVYSFRPIQAAPNMALISRLRKAIIYAASFSSIKHIVESLALIISLTSRDIYSQELCEAVFQASKGEEKRFIKATQDNPQIIFSAIYGNNNFTTAELLPIIEIMPLMNIIFKADEALVPFIYRVFEHFETDPNFIILKTIVEQISCIQQAPHMALAFLLATKNHFDTIKIILEKEKVFAAYYMIVLAHFIDICIESIIQTDIEQSVSVFTESVLELVVRTDLKDVTLPPIINSLLSDEPSEEVNYFINYMSTSIPFQQKKTPSEDILKYERICLAAILVGSKSVDVAEAFSKSIFNDKIKPIPKNTSSIPPKLKTIWKSIYVIRRNLMNSYQRVVSSSKSSDLKDNFNDYTKEISEKAGFLLTSKDLKLKSTEFDDMVQELMKFLCCSFRIEDIKYIVAIKDDRLEIRKKALDFLTQISPKLSANDEFYLYANIQNNFHRVESATKEKVAALKESITKLEQFIKDRSCSTVSHECIVSYSMHSYIPFPVLLKTITTCKNETLVNATWYTVLYNTIKYQDSGFVQGLIELATDYTVEKHQLYSLSILQRIEISPVPVQKLMEKYAKYQTESLYIFLSSSATAAEDIDQTLLMKYVNMMLQSIGAYIFTSTGILSVIDEMICFVRSQIQKQMVKTRETTLKAIHNALMKMNRRMPKETIGALVCIGFGGLPNTANHSVKNGVVTSILENENNCIPCARILPNSEDFEITNEEAALFETTLAQFTNIVMTQKSLSQQDTLMFEVFFASLPIILQNKANVAKFSPKFPQILAKIAFNDAGEILPLGEFMTYFGNITNKTIFQKHNLFSIVQDQNGFIPICALQDGSKQIVRIFNRTIKLSESVVLPKISLTETTKPVFFGFITPETSSTEVIVHGYQFDGKGHAFISWETINGQLFMSSQSEGFGFLNYTTDIIPVVISDGGFASSAGEIPSHLDVSIVEETTSFSLPFLGSTICIGGITGVVTESTGKQLLMHAGNGRIISVKAKNCHIANEKLSYVFQRIQTAKKEDPNKTPDHFIKLRTFMILLCRLSALSFLKENKFSDNSEDVDHLLYKCIMSFFKFHVEMKPLSYDDYDSLTPINMKTYKSFILKYLSNQTVFESLCKYSVEALLNATEFTEEYRCTSQRFLTPPGTAAMIPSPRNLFTSDFYPPGEIQITSDPKDNPSMRLNRVRVLPIDGTTIIYATTTILNLMRFAGPGLLGIYCRTIFPRIKNNVMFLSVIMNKVRSNKKLLTSTVRVMMPPPTDINKFFSGDLNQELQYLSLWANVKFILYDDALAEAEEQTKLTHKHKMPEPMNQKIFGDPRFSSLIDVFITLASTADQSMGIPRFPLYLYGKLFYTDITESKELKFSTTLKDLGDNCEIGFASIEGGKIENESVELVIADKKYKLKIGEKIKCPATTCRVNLIGTKGKKVTITIKQKTAPGTYIPDDFRKLCQRAEKVWTPMNDISLLRAINSSKPIPDFPGVDPSLVKIRGALLTNVRRLSAQYHMTAFVSSASYSLEEITSIFKDNIRKYLDKYPQSCEFIVLDRFNAAWFYESGKGRTLVRQLDRYLKNNRTPLQQLAYFTNAWNVEFKGEGSIDAGGPRREAFDDLCDEIILHDNIFVESPASREKHEGRKIPLTTAFFNDLKVAGALVAATLPLDNRRPFHFEPIVWKVIAGMKITEQDVTDIDPELHDVIEGIRNGMTGEITHKGISGKVFNKFLLTERTSQARRDKIVSTIISQRIGEMEKVFTPFVNGFHSIIPLSLTSAIPYQLLEEILCAEEELSVSQLLNHMSITAYPIAQKMFIDALNILTSSQRRKLVKFATGSTALPTGTKKIRVSITWVDDPSKMDMRNGPLPHAGTCFMTLSMPFYSSVEVMVAKLITAMEFSSFITDVDMDFGSFVQP